MSNPSTSSSHRNSVRWIATVAAVAAIAAPAAQAVNLPIEGPVGHTQQPVAAVAAASSDAAGIQWSQIGASAGAGVLLTLAIGAGVVGARRGHTRRSAT